MLQVDDMSISHLILLFLILLLIFGPSRLEGLGLSLGRAISGFKKGMEEGSAPSKSTTSATTTAQVDEQKPDTKL